MTNILHLLSSVRKRWGFHYDAALLLVLGLFSAFAVARHAAHTSAATATASANGLPTPVTVRAPPAGAVYDAPSVATATTEVWPRGARFERLVEIGRGKGIVFSPDFSVPENRRFYERLGFAYFEGADWRDVLARVRAYNRTHPERPIETLILEAHGTNGHGLKLQAGGAPKAPRSYVSVGGLQQQLAGAGVRLSVIAACNSGRLFRPEIYYTLDTHPGDPLFLPATRGVVNAAPGFRANESDMRVLYPAASHLEAANEGYIREFAPRTIALLGGDPGTEKAVRPAGATGGRFVVSDALIGMLLNDPDLKLTAEGYVTEKSAGVFAAAESESLMQRFIALVNEVAAREYSDTRGDGGFDGDKVDGSRMARVPAGTN
ncbi:MAG: hypothetical protein ACJ74T_02780 [Pyrinomonadaceae bacterium]